MLLVIADCRRGGFGLILREPLAFSMFESSIWARVVLVLWRFISRQINDHTDVKNTGKIAWREY